MKGIRNLGLAVATALVVIAFVGSAVASAAQFESAIEKTEYEAGSTTTMQFLHGIEWKYNLKCETVTLKRNGAIEGKNTPEITLKPNFTNCTIGPYGFKATVQNQGECNFRLHAERENQTKKEKRSARWTCCARRRANPESVSPPRLD